MNNLLPYKVEYSVGELECTKCSKKIRSGCLKIAIMMQSDQDDCQYPDWYHQKCFFKTHLPKTEAAFDGFAKLRYADQLAIKVHLGTMEVDSKNVTKTTKLPDFGIEYTRVDRDLCDGCRQKIRIPEVRIMNVVYDTDQDTAFDGKATWYHILCFARSRYDLGWLQSAELIPGFRRLAEEDKKIIKAQIPVIKRKLYKPIESSNLNLADLEKQIETQNLEYYALYDNLAKNVSKKDQVTMLNKNWQLVPETKTEILHHLTDVLYFGALNSCSKCYKGKLYFNNSTYVCTTMKSWGRCDNDVKEPARISRCIPLDLLKKYPFLNPYLFKSVQTRALHRFRLTDENGQDLVYAPHKNLPLFNMEFALIGKLEKSKQEIENTIKKMGGKVVTTIHDKLAAVISNQEEVRKMGSKMAEAKKCNIQVLSEDFLSHVEIMDPIRYILSQDLTEWGGNPYTRIEQNVVKSRRETMAYTKSLPEKITYKWKATDNGYNAVEPECGLDQNAHIYCEQKNGINVKYSVILGLVNIENNKNSYYRMQLLESNDNQRYCIFESWGRISTIIGSNQLIYYGTLEEACEKFKLNYKEKTGNDFGQWFHPVKNPNKFYHLDINFDFTKAMPKSFVKSKLNESVYELMQLIFDTKQMKESMMVSCDLDLKQMPLGKISAKQIHSAMKVLQYISKLITENGTAGKLLDASNEFYTMIPHGFSVKRPPVIDSIDVVNAKHEMLESLLNMDLIYGFLEGENGEKRNQFDACYEKLNTEITPLDRNSSEFTKICDIVRNTHGQTHNQYTLEVIEVFKVKRKREDVRFRAYKNLCNHQLLWHGSRLTNFVSILSKGLRIAPRQAQSTGTMFGKGIYFSDIVSKSANYCCPYYEKNGLMLLCEVALGKTHNPQFASKIAHLPNENEQSVKGCGATFPTEYSTLGGVKVAVGGLRRADFPTGLQYNEFVVYDISQVKMKYLIKIKFHGK